MKKLTLLLTLLAPLAFQAQLTAVSDMNEVRAGHAAATIDGADVLVTGGFGDGAYLNSAEYFEFESETWVEVDPMSTVRYGHTANGIGNNKVLVCGGWDGELTNHLTTEIYDHTFETWEDGPDMAVGRSNHQSVLLLDYRILISGGFDGTNDLANCEIYDPVSNTFTVVGDMQMARSSHTLTLLPDGKVLATGGFNPNFGFQLNTCEIFDPATNLWTTVSPMTYGRDNHAAVLMPDGQILVAGGRYFNGDLNLFEGQLECEYYNTTNDTWSSAGQMTEGQSYVKLFNVNGTIFMPGGVDQTGNGVTTTYSSGATFNNGTEEWTILTDTDAGGRYRYAATHITEGTVLVCGGEDAGAYLFSIITNTNDMDDIEVEVYPNPASEELIIRGVRVDRWVLVNTLGMEVATGEGSDVHLPNGLTTGNYILHVASGDAWFCTHVALK
ncbi:MAG: hypothetical protein KDC12_04565 [Flavobacteriales bacterium]|nr:hypothetical protein [Flavobacteriales bacterium]